MRLSLEAAPKGPLQQVLFLDRRKHGAQGFGAWNVNVNPNMLSICTSNCDKLIINMLLYRN